MYISGYAGTVLYILSQTGTGSDKNIQIKHPLFTTLATCILKKGQRKDELNCRLYKKILIFIVESDQAIRTPLMKLLVLESCTLRLSHC